MYRTLLSLLWNLRLHARNLEDQAALALFDVFKVQQTELISSLLAQYYIIAVPIPANCTDRLQPMDLTINEAAKEFMHCKFHEWYASEVQKQLDKGESSPVDLKTSTVKPLRAKWVKSLYDHIKKQDLLVVNGFKAAGMV